MILLPLDRARPAVSPCLHSLCKAKLTGCWLQLRTYCTDVEYRFSLTLGRKANECTSSNVRLFQDPPPKPLWLCSLNIYYLWPNWAGLCVHSEVWLGSTGCSSCLGVTSWTNTGWGDPGLSVPCWAGIGPRQQGVILVYGHLRASCCFNSCL